MRATRVAPVVFTNDVVDDFETLVADRVAPGTAQERAHLFRVLLTKTTAKSDRFVHGTCGSRAADYFIPIRRVSFIRDFRYVPYLARELDFVPDVE